MKKKKMSKTPRTDEHLRWKRENGYIAIVSQEFARQLEIELAEAKAKLRKLREKNDKKENEKLPIIG